MATGSIVADQTAMLALPAVQGDWCYRSDVKKTYRLIGLDPTSLGDWQVRGLPRGTSIYTDEATGATRIDRDEVAGTFLMNAYAGDNLRIEPRTNDPSSPAVGQLWLRTDL